MNLFDPDSKLIQFLQFLGGLILLNLCFVAACIPLVTIGAACSALYTVTMQEAEDRSGSIPGRFFRAFRSNFPKATGLWLLLALFGGILGYNLLFLRSNPGFSHPVLWGLLIAMTVLYLMMAAYAFPLQARFENTVMQTLRNSLVLAIGHLPKTVLLVALNVLPLAVLLISEELFIRLSIFLVMLYFAVAAQLNSMLLVRIFRQVQT